MIKAILFALLFVILGLVAFSLITPLIFTGDLRAIGATAFPMIAVLCGLVGFFVGWRARRKGE